MQGAIALEALVSAAFILIGGKTGDLIGRKVAYILGLLGYAVGAVAMTMAQDLTTVIIFWAVIGGLGASLLLPSMQSLIHGNFQGAHQKRVYALVGASAAIAAAVGPLLGGFITTFLSWRVGFLLEAVIIAIVLAGIGLVKDVRFTGDRSIDLVGSALSVIGMGGVVLGILVWQEGGGYVALIIGLGVVALGGLVFWLNSRKKRGKPTLIDPALFASKPFRAGVSGQLLQQITLGGTMIVLPLYLQMVLEYNALQAGLSIAPLSLSMFAVALIAGRVAKGRPANLILWGFVLTVIGLVVIVPLVPIADSGWYLTIPLLVSGSGLGLLVSQLNNYTLSPITDERVSEAAGVNSAAGSFGLSFGLAFAGAIMLATLAVGFTALADSSERAHRRAAAAGLHGARRRRRADVQHRARGTARRGNPRSLGGDDPHQHRGAASRPAGRAPDPDPRGGRRHPERVPDAPAPRPRGCGIGRHASWADRKSTRRRRTEVEPTRINFI